MYSATAPGSPGSGEQRFLVVRARARAGTIRCVWNPAFTVREVTMHDGRIRMVSGDGAEIEFERLPDGAHIRRSTSNASGKRDDLVLSGFRAAASAPNASDAPSDTTPAASVKQLPFSRDLGETDYRMSEHSWAEAGEPRAHVEIFADASQLDILVRVRKSPLTFRVANAPDPGLDNEDPDINSDGVQLHLS